MRTPPRILIADDNEMNVDILQTCLAGHGYVIVTATDGEAALRLCKETQPDLVLLDVMMPKMDGTEVCYRIRQDTSLPMIPIILVTAKSDSRDIVAGLAAGADEYLTKPVDQAALVARVNSMLRIKELYDKTQDQAKRLEVQAALLAERNEELQIKLFQEEKLAEIARLIGDIGHDIKNMMMPIVTGAELIANELEESLQSLPSTKCDQVKSSQALSKEVRGMVKNSSRRMQDRLKEISDAVKGRSSPPSFAPCQVATVLASVFHALRLYAETSGVSLHNEGLEQLPLIQADDGRLFNALYNLINNAIPETPAGGSVTVTALCEPESKSIALYVRDTGRGMPPEVLGSLFTPRVISRKSGGTGLGTKIVKDVVDAHGGTIAVESKEGKGTTFMIRLPIDQSGMVAPAEARPEAPRKSDVERHVWGQQV